MRYLKNINNNTRDGVIYARVSSAKQVTQGHGLDSQTLHCSAHALRCGIDVKRTFKEEGISGALNKRPALEKLYQYAAEYQKSHKENPRELIVLFYDVARLSRDMQGYHGIKSKLTSLGCRIEFVTQKFGDDSTGRFMENIIVAFGDMERQKNSERTRDKMKARVEAGYWVYGQIPIGYQSSKLRGLKEPNPNTKNIIKRALDYQIYLIQLFFV